MQNNIYTALIYNVTKMLKKWPCTDIRYSLIVTVTHVTLQQNCALVLVHVFENLHNIILALPYGLCEESDELCENVAIFTQYLCVLCIFMLISLAFLIVVRFNCS